jgi:hypothetical protein
MRFTTTTLGLAGILLAGCYEEPPHERVVERHYDTAPSGQVTETDVVVDPPANYVEVQPLAPYVGAVWVGGTYEERGGHRYYHRGYWH